MSSADPAPSSSTNTTSKKKKAAPSSDPSQHYFSSLASNLAALPPSSPDLSGLFVLYGAAPVVAVLRDPVCALVGGKGGGRPGRLQGTAVRLQALAEVDTLVHCHIQQE